MGATVIDRMKSSVHVEEGDPNSVNYDGSSGAGRNFVCVGNYNEIIHGCDVSIALLKAAPEGVVA